MIHRMYVIYDSAAQIYNKPFVMTNDATAIRAAEDLRNDPTTEPGRHPEHFSLWSKGHYDDCTAIFTDQIPEHIISFHEIALRPIMKADPESPLNPENQE